MSATKAKTENNVSKIEIANNLTELKALSLADLIKLAETMGMGAENIARQRKQDIIFSILKTKAYEGADIFGDGVLEILPDGFGFLRSADDSYLAGPDDIYVSPSQIRRFSLTYRRYHFW